MSPLPVDILIVIFSQLALSDLSRVRRSCKTFLEITQLKDLWLRLINAHVLEKGLPVPGLARRLPTALSAQELEESTIRALQLRKNWTSGFPDVATIRERNINTNQGRVVSANFLPGHGGRYLVSFSAEAHPRDPSAKYALQCWDLEPDQPVCIALRTFGVYRGYVLNCDPSSAYTLALQTNRLEVLSINFQSSSLHDGFATVKTLLNHANPITNLSGNWLLTRTKDFQVLLRSIDQFDVQIQLLNSGAPPGRDVQDAIFGKGFVLVVRSTMMELYAINEESLSFGDHALEPIIQHAWQWPLDQVSISRQWPGSYDVEREVNILIRFGSFFPWPTNMLHHHVLNPNSGFDADSPISAINLPFDFPPTAVRTIASPIRLHATSCMALGSYGTAIWVDSHTEDYFYHSHSGQRLVGSLLSERPTHGGAEVDELAAMSMTAGTIVYAARERDDWISIALEEEEGKLVLGGATGTISVLEYI